MFTGKLTTYTVELIIESAWEVGCNIRLWWSNKVAPVSSFSTDRPVVVRERLVVGAKVGLGKAIQSRGARVIRRSPGEK